MVVIWFRMLNCPNANHYHKTNSECKSQQLFLFQNSGILEGQTLPKLKIQLVSEVEIRFQHLERLKKTKASLPE